jgi:pyruvate kinase
MSRYNCGCPIYALTPEITAQRKMALYRNVQPLYFEGGTDRETVLQAAEDFMLDKGLVKAGDLIVLTSGEPMGKSGGTNTMRIVRVGDARG